MGTGRRSGAGELPALVERLREHHGAPCRLPPRKALDWVLWENVAYLVPDARREAAYRALEERTGLRADGLLALPREELQELAALGGMLPDRRVEKLLAVATTVRDAFGGDLESVLGLPLAQARKALKRFPGIGDPGADRILLFTGAHAVPALESNGLRVLVRLGLVEEAKSYATTYRRARGLLAEHAGGRAPWLRRAHDLLRAHGQELCKNNAPLCDACPLEAHCPSAS